MPGLLAGLGGSPQQLAPEPVLPARRWEALAWLLQPSLHWCIGSGLRHGFQGGGFQPLCCLLGHWFGDRECYCSILKLCSKFV